MQIQYHTFLVPGGARGLGEACVRRLIAGGAKVVVADLNEKAGTALATELKDSARFARTDVTNPSDAQAAIDLATREFGSLHGLIQCAGILSGGRIFGKDGPHDLAAFERVIRVNLIGTFNMLRLAA